MGNAWAEAIWIVDNIKKGLFSATINVKARQGFSLRCERYGVVLTGTPNESGDYAFIVPKAGIWNVSATQGSEVYSETVNITEDGMITSVDLRGLVYGISKNITVSSPSWARIDNAVGLTATPSVGAAAGSSDFDNVYPWSEMKRVTLSTGDRMVKIPKFYFKRYREGNIEYLKISKYALDGFKLHPAFDRPDGVREQVYIGAYKTSSNNKSVSGAAPTVSVTRATMRSNAKNKGTGWYLQDVSIVSAVQMLFLVEFANSNSQAAIGRGFVDSNSSALSSGSCDGVANLTGRPSGTDGKVDVVYRGIEGIWGNILEFVDGCNLNGYNIYVCNDPTKYADDISSNYTKLSYTLPSSGYISKMGLDTGNNDHVLLPMASVGSESTYECDYCYTSSSDSWYIFSRGGRWDRGSGVGLFYSDLNDGSSYSHSGFGSRLMYLGA